MVKARCGQSNCSMVYVSTCMAYVFMTFRLVSLHLCLLKNFFQRRVSATDVETHDSYINKNHVHDKVVPLYGYRMVVGQGRSRQVGYRVLRFAVTESVKYTTVRLLMSPGTFCPTLFVRHVPVACVLLYNVFKSTVAVSILGA